MGVRSIFSKGGIVDFSIWWTKAFFHRGNSGEISFYQLKINKNIFVLKN